MKEAHSPYIYVCSVASAVLLHVSLWSGVWGCIGTLISIMLLLYGIISCTRLSYGLYGILWAGAFFTLHWSAVFYLLYEYGYGMARYIAPCILIGYACSITGIIFACAGVGLRFIKIYIHRLIVGICFTAAWFWVMRYGYMLPFGLSDYALSSPLLPWVHVSYMLSCISLAGYEMYILSFVATAGVILLTIKRSRQYWKLTTMFFVGWLVIWVLGYIRTGTSGSKICLADYVYIRPALCSSDISAWDYAQELTYHLSKRLASFSRAQHVLMPESTFPFPLNQYPEVMRLWSENALGERTLYIGTHMQENNALYNTLCVVQNAKICGSYTKQHLMPFTECVPKEWSWFPGCVALFFHNRAQFSSVCTRCSTWPVTAGHFYPCICSELFFPARGYEMEMRALSDDRSILCVAKESWFSLTYMHNLMFSCARLRAIEWNKCIFYVSHRCGVYLSPSGAVTVLPST